eukprot:gene3347-6019_t
MTSTTAVHTYTRTQMYFIGMRTRHKIHSCNTGMKEHVEYDVECVRVYEGMKEHVEYDVECVGVYEGMKEHVEYDVECSYMVICKDIPNNSLDHFTSLWFQSKQYFQEELASVACTNNIGSIVQPPAAIALTDDNRGCENLQESFRRFKLKKKEKLKKARVLQDRNAIQTRSIEAKNKLREKFVKQALKYLGVPYHKKYHQDPTSHFLGEHYHAPLYLDCCGLIRRAQRDLHNEFGFSMGRWNQAYQFDTLPAEIPKHEMKPGDLVFISGTYFSTKSKKQKHDIVHVEIWLGDGEKTIGARHQCGVIQIHDSYAFVSKSYYNMQYYFRSIDPWLNGECKSHCKEHSWLPGKSKSACLFVFFSKVYYLRTYLSSLHCWFAVNRKNKFSIFQTQSQSSSSSSSSLATSREDSLQEDFLQHQQQRNSEISRNGEARCKECLDKQPQPTICQFPMQQHPKQGLDR